MAEQNSEARELSRRSFLKIAGGTAAGAILGAGLYSWGSAETREATAPTTTAPPKVQLQFNPELCMGCMKCVLACSLAKEGVCNPELARLRLDVNPLEAYNVQNLCRQCLGPECLLACLCGAIDVDSETGARVVIEEKCLGCGRCVDACQFGMIKLHPETGRAFKCDLCGGDPVCVKVCPSSALTFKEV